MDDLTKVGTVTLRDYIKVYFRRKAVLFITFLTVIALLTLLALIQTPVYEAQVTMLISAQKKIEAPYYQEASSAYSSGASIIALTQSEIVLSNPVIERAVRVLMLHERPKDYERKYASPVGKALMDLTSGFFQGLKRSMKKQIKPEEQRKIIFRMAVAGLKKNINVTPLKNTNLLTISVKDFSPEAAAQIANVVSRSYVIFDLEQQLAEYQLKYQQTHQIVRQLYNDVNKLINKLKSEPRSNIEAIGPASVKIIAPASIPLKPVTIQGKKLILAIILAVFVAAFCSIAAALIFEYLDPTFKSPQDIETYIKLPYLGFIPKAGRKNRKIIDDITLGNGKENHYLKAYKQFSDNLYLLIKSRKLKSILMVSALQGEGTNILTANLSVFMSRKFFKDTLIIDANLRKPSMHNLFNIPSRPGLAGILEDQVALEDAVTKLDSHLNIMPAGNSSFDPIALLSSIKMNDIISQAQEKYEVVLIDCANLSDYKDGEVISLNTDGVVYVVCEGRTRRQVVKNAVKLWENRRSNLLGVVLNNRRFVIPEMLYMRI